MQNLLTKIRSYRLPQTSVPIVLLGICILSYGSFIPKLGFYWDDWPINWIAQNLGLDGLARYFSTNRPYWGKIYQVTTQILGSNPIIWQIFALIWRWFAGISLWLLLRQVWQKNSQIASWASILFIVYPGFRQQHISLVYSHFFIVLTAFLLSLYLCLIAIRKPEYFWILTAGSLLLSFINLITMEYFFILELIRPVLIWTVLEKEDCPGKETIKKALLFSSPYLLLFLSMGIWRAFFFPYQTTNYQPQIIEGLKTQPLHAIGLLFSTIFRDIGLTGFGAWLNAFRIPDAVEFGKRSTLVYWGVVIISGLLVYFFELALKSAKSNSIDDKNTFYSFIKAIIIGLLFILLAGWPFWLTDIPLGLEFPGDRFTISFMVGASLLLTVLILYLPVWKWLKYLLLALLVGFGAGKQIETGVLFYRDWNVQQNFFWQLQWRIPQLEPGTAILANDMPFRYTTDNSLSGPLNYIYAPDNHSEQMDYILYYPTLRLGSGLPAFRENLPIQQDYLAADFNGNTSQMIAINYDYKTCLRVLDPDVDSNNWLIPEIMRDAAKLSNIDAIVPENNDMVLSKLQNTYGPEPSHTWCYYYQKADLARQQSDWEQVAALGDEAFSLGDYPNGPSERIPFIEGYAHTGNWDRAYELTQNTYQISALMAKSLCPLWQRIDENTIDSSKKEEVVKQVFAELGCKP